jgi:hypothetical protein
VRKVAQRLINMKKSNDKRNKGATMQKTDTRSYVTKAMSIESQQKKETSECKDTGETKRKGHKKQAQLRGE